MNGDEIPVERVAGLPRRLEADLDDVFAQATPGQGAVSEPVTRLRAVEPVAGVSGGTGTSLDAEQRRQLHIRVHARRRPGGVTEIEQQLFRPRGSMFRLLSVEAPPDGSGVAPDAASYVAAGIAFCFMTQQGRYATIVRKELPDYRVVQDLHLSTGSIPGAPERSAVADPVETHVYLTTPEGEAFARRSLDMAEQTCFLHALCRTPLQPTVSVTSLQNSA